MGKYRERVKGEAGIGERGIEGSERRVGGREEEGVDGGGGKKGRMEKGKEG